MYTSFKGYWRKKLKGVIGRQITELPENPPSLQQGAGALINGQTSLCVDLFCPLIFLHSQIQPHSQNVSRQNWGNT